MTCFICLFKIGFFKIMWMASLSCNLKWDLSLLMTSNQSKILTCLQCKIKINKIKNKKSVLRKNMYPIFVIGNQIKKFLEIQYTTESNKNTIDNNEKEVYFKLLYIETFSKATRSKRKQICGKYCKDTNIAAGSSSLKIENFFSCKDSIHKFLQSFVVYQFTCLGWNACYIGETKHYW